MNWALVFGIIAGVLLFVLTLTVGYASGVAITKKDQVTHDEGITGPPGPPGPAGMTGPMGVEGPEGKCDHEAVVRQLVADVDNLKERMPRVERKAGMSV